MVRLQVSFYRASVSFSLGCPAKSSPGSEWGVGVGMRRTCPSQRLVFIVSDIIDIPFLLSASPFEMTFDQKILSIRLIEAFGFKLEDFQFTLWCHRCLPAFWFTQEDAEDIAFEEWLLSPCGIKNCKSLFGIADPGVDVCVTVSSRGDFASHVYKFSNLL